MRIDDLLKKRLLQYQRTGGDWAKAVCPFHKDTKPSFYINMKSGFWGCFGCGVRGQLQELLDRLKIRSIRADQVVAKYKPELRNPNEVNHLPDYILGAYHSCPTRLLEAGFKKDVLKAHEVGYDAENYRITFPIRDKDGKLAAISGRNLHGEPKYQIYTYEEEFPEYKPRPKDHLWNLHRLVGDLQTGNDPLYIVEGFKAGMWLTQHGYNAVATIGTQMTKRQIRLLSKFDVPLVLSMDNDSAGRAATIVNYLEISRNQIARVVNYPPNIKQLDDMDEDLLHKTLAKPQEFRRFYDVVQKQDESISRSLGRRRKAFLNVSRKSG